jgi:NTP pyrophosphatase (non-canonical NTP hydrolase)
MNLLVKELGELREGKKQRDSKYQVAINLEDLLYRIQLHSVKAGIERVKIS